MHVCISIKIASNTLRLHATTQANVAHEAHDLATVVPSSAMHSPYAAHSPLM